MRNFQMSKNGGRRQIKFWFDPKLQKNILICSNVLSSNQTGYYSIFVSYKLYKILQCNSTIQKF